MNLTAMKNRTVLLLTLAFLVIFLSFLYRLSLRAQPNQADLLDFVPEEQEYQLQADDNFVRPAGFELPTVQTKPGASLRYQIAQQIELIDLKTKKYTPLFFADKRVAELIRWGKEFDYDMWENILNRYFDLLKQSIDNSLTRQPANSLADIYSHVLTHQTLISQKIAEFGPDDKQKRLMQILSDDIFHAIDKKFDRLLQDPPVNWTVYPLNEILKNRDFGYYNILIDFADLPGVDRTDIHLVLGGQSYLPSYFDKENKQLVFEKIPITLREKSIILRLKSINLTPYPTWEITLPSTGEEPYQYKLPLINLPLPVRYRWQFTSKLGQPAKLQLEQSYATEEAILNKRTDEVIGYFPTVQSDELINFQLYPHYISFTAKDQTDVKTLRQNVIKTWVKLTTKGKLSGEQIQSLRFDIFPFLSPSITAVKAADLPDNKPSINQFPQKNHRYRLILKNTSLAQNQYVMQSIGFGWQPTKVIADNPSAFEVELGFWPSAVLRNILIFAIICLFFYANWYYLKIKCPAHTNWVAQLFSKTTAVKITRVLIFPLKLILILIKSLSANFRLFWLVITLVGILFDIFFFKKSSDFITILFTLTWSFSLVGFRFEARTSFLFALLCLTLCPFLLIFKLEFMAEKAAIWTYMMLVVGTVQSIVEAKTNPRGLISPIPVFKRILLLFFHFLNFINKQIIRLVQLIIKLLILIINQIINTKPKTIYDLILNAIKVVLFFTISLITSYFLIRTVYLYGKHSYQKYQRKIAQEKREKLWKSIIPAIDKVEPYLVYRGMKVVIYGRNFGWKEKPEIKIIDDKGKEVPPDEITDSQVVFTIPLSWSDGVHDFRIDKIVGWDGKNVKVETDTFSIKIIPVTGGYTQDDEEFFKLLPSLAPETRKRNGYD